MDLVNPLMSRVGVLVKRGRERFWDAQDYVIRISSRNNQPDAAVFFRTEGCRHDLAGGCTMCDYSVGPKTSPEQMIGAVQRAISELPAGLGHLLVSPSGSFLDMHEVPRIARRGILELMRQSGIPRLSFESRAETITGEAVEDCGIVAPRQRLKVYLGLESADPWISKYCVNKELSLNIFRRSVELLGEASIDTSANTVVGTLFLSPAEAIADAVETTRWALSAGVTECCLFPIHVKRWTQLHWFYQQGMYEPPSLWSFIEVLRSLGPEIVSSRIEIAWFTSYGAFNIEASPETCPSCYDFVVEKLTRFADTSDYEYVDQLVRFECGCKGEWMRSLENDTAGEKIETAVRAYERIGNELLGNSWWRNNGDRLLETMKSEYARPARSAEGA